MACSSWSRLPGIGSANVLVGACLGQGTSAGIVEACLHARATPLMAAALLAGHEDVLGRVVLFAKSRLDAAERDELLDVFLVRSCWTRICSGWRPNLRDEGDDRLTELAVAGGAQYVVSHNVCDLLAHELTFPGPVALVPADWLKRLCTEEKP
ncbi:MAG: PIN domain-containing protein [Rubrivivax sp.]